jgi:hypothetical protein
MPPPVPCLTKLRQETVERLHTLCPPFKHVYDSRLPQLRRDLLPAIRVYTTSETSSGQSISIPDFRVTGELVIQLVCEDITDAKIAARIDRYVDIVKNRLLSDGDWLQLFERVLSMNTEFARSVEGEWRSTNATITFELQYTCVWEPLVPDWFETLRLDVDVIDPAADPNTGPPGTPPNVEGGYPGGWPGPDGRIEVEAQFVNPKPPEGWTPPTPAKGK